MGYKEGLLDIIQKSVQTQDQSWLKKMCPKV